MAPPAIAALALLGVWILLTLWATTTTARAQARADDQFVIAADDSDQSRSSSETASEPSFSAADD